MLLRPESENATISVQRKGWSNAQDWSDPEPGTRPAHRVQRGGDDRTTAHNTIACYVTYGTSRHTPDLYSVKDGG